MSHGFLKENRESEWTPYRNLLAWIVGLGVMEGPGLFWLYVFADALQRRPTAFWFGPTPTGGTSVFARYIGAIILFVVWTALVLALFHQPLGKTIREVRK